MRSGLHTLACAGAFAFLALRTSEAHASDEPAVKESATLPARSYGWQIAAADASSTALVGGSLVALEAGARGKNSVLAWAGRVGLVGYGFGGPIIHWSHGNVARGFASLGLRLAAPLFAAATYGGSYMLFKAGRGGSCGDIHADDYEDECEPRAWMIAAPVGVASVVSVMLVDALFLAKEPARRPARASMADVFRDLSPSIRVGADRAAFVVSGRLF